MELWDRNGDEPWRNILWIIALAAAGMLLTSIYTDSVKQEKLEATYKETVGYLKEAEPWVRVRTQNGHETSRESYYKFSYTYEVEAHTYNSNGTQNNSPAATFPVYYDPAKPLKHVLHRHRSDDALAGLILGGLVIFVFLGVNVYLFNSKRRKLGTARSGVGSFEH